MESPFDDDITEAKELSKTPSLEQVERYAAKRQRWEENVIKRILALGGKSQFAKKLIHDNCTYTGENRLTFSSFRMEFPIFPIYLDFEKPSYKALAKFEKQLLTMRKADKNSLVDIFYQGFAAVDTHGKAYGIVFEWLHHGSPYKIVHNHDYAVNQQLGGPYYPGVRFSVAMSDEDVLYVEDLDCYLRTIGWVE